ncbi:MAG: hypothetical protein ACLQVD_09670 [Capsulimonadaceae bacterium]
MAQTLTISLPEHEAEEIRRIAQRDRRTPNEVAASIIDEWLRLSRFPEIEFRHEYGDRSACLKGRLDVWKVIMVAQDYQGDVAQTADALGLRQEQVEAALNYYSSYPIEIDSALAENEQGYDQLRRLLSQAERRVFTDSDLAAVEFSIPRR